MNKFLFVTLFVALFFSTGAIATGDDFRTYHEKNFVHKDVLDESKLDAKTLELLNLARERGKTDPRLETFSKSFEYNLARSQGLQERDKDYRRLIMVGQIKDFDHSIPMSGSCYILDYGIFVGCSIMDPVKKRNGEETGRFTSGFWFFDRSFQFEPITEKINVKTNEKSLHVGTFSLVPRDPDSFVTIQGKAETGISSIGIRFRISRIQEVAAQFKPKEWIWYPVAPDGTFSMGPLPPHRYELLAKQGDQIIEKLGDFVPLDEKNSEEILRVSRDEEEGLMAYFGEEVPEIPFPLVLNVDRRGYKDAVKIKVEALEKTSGRLIHEETYDLDQKGRVSINLKTSPTYNFYLLNEKNQVIASNLSMRYFLPKPIRKIRETTMTFLK